jgi:hypothetical protein
VLPKESGREPSAVMLMGTPEEVKHRYFAAQKLKKRAAYADEVKYMYKPKASEKKMQELESLKK